VSNYLKNVSEITEFSLEYLLDLYKSEDILIKSKLDDILFMYGHYVLNSTGAEVINSYAGADMQPTMFSIGTPREVYGEDYYKSGPNNETKKDIYYYFPGIIAELIDPITGELIPRTEHRKPGILLEWNPYNISHLQVPKTEDMLQWVELPETVKAKIPYMQGVGLQFVSRVPGAKGQGVCS